MPNTAFFAPTPSRPVVFFVYDGVHILDVAGPLQALTTANDEGARIPYAPQVAALAPGSVRTASGLGIEAIGSGGFCTPLDTVILPGGPGVHQACGKPDIVAEAARLCGLARRICTVCTGAFLAAHAGILDNRRVVTHWRSCERLAAAFPALTVDPRPLFLRDGHIWTSAGVTAGIDLALALVEEDCGAALAARVARRLVVYLRRPGGQSQCSTLLSLQTVSASPYAALLERVAAHPSEDWSVDRLAQESFQSARTFHRLFRRATGRTPASVVEDIRFEAARILLETTQLPIKTVAAQSGLGTESALRRVFARRMGLSPRGVRLRFGIQEHPGAQSSHPR